MNQNKVKLNQTNLHLGYAAHAVRNLYAKQQNADVATWAAAVGHHAAVHPQSAATEKHS